MYNRSPLVLLIVLFSVSGKSQNGFSATNQRKFFNTIFSSFSGISSDPDDVKFYLFHDSNDMGKFSEIKFGDIVSLRSSKYQKRLDSATIVIHGFVSSAFRVAYPRNVIKAYLKTRNDSNYIAVDWSKLGYPFLDDPLLYPVVVSHIKVVGDRVGAFVDFLIETNYLSSPSKVHVIGHSLGAHVSGRVGDYIKSHALPRLGRITGLDPAGLQFQNNSINSRLDNEDADFVDTIHTSNLGYVGGIGHISFFPNAGGASQPNCGFDPFSVCAHNKVGDYYAFSIYNNTITGCECTFERIPINNTYSCKPTDGICEQGGPVFGEYTSKTARGNYYVKLETTSDYRFLE